MMRKSHSRHIPSWLDGCIALALEALYCTLVFIKAAFPYLLDIFYTNVVQSAEDRLPGSVADLLDPKLFSKVSGKRVLKVEYSEQVEQHANSTDRAWFKVRYDCDSEDTYVFAKVQAKTFLVRVLMCMFDVYRNELHAYSSLTFPVQTPTVHVVKWTPSRFCLVLGDLRKEGAELPNIWETNLTKDLTKEILATIAAIHVKFWGNAPYGAWNDTSRPYFASMMGFATLARVSYMCPGALDEDAMETYKLGLWNWNALREFYSRPGYKTMVHGDTHLGNFFITKDKKIGVFDFQVKSEDHPMRDVTYFLASSYPEDKLAEDEKELISFYLTKLEEFGCPDVPKFDECWLQYRMWGYQTLYNFVVSGGFSDLMDPLQTRCGVKRICAQMKRVDARGALVDYLDGKV